MKKLVAFIPVFLILAMALITCQKPVRDNPWDEKANIIPDEWTPKTLQLEDSNITSKKLVWTYDGDDRIEGFQIDRKKGNDDWVEGYFITDKKMRTWIDDKIIPDTLSKYTYRLFTIAGKNRSSEITASFVPTFPAPSNLQITANSNSSITLKWENNNSGYQGFKIDKKINEDDWIVGFASVNNLIDNYVDNNVNLNNDRYTYRIYAFYSIFYSPKLTAYLSKPSVTSNDITSISAISANGGGIVIEDGGAPVTVRGVVWSTFQNPTTNSNTGMTINEGGKGTFVSNLTELSESTIYYVRAYATNNAGTAYGSQVQFTTLTSHIPTIISSNISNISSTVATGGGIVTDEGGLPVIAGVVWSTSQNPTTNSNIGMTNSGIDISSFVSNLTDLFPNTIYYVRAYAINSKGTAYGSQITFQTRNEIITGTFIDTRDNKTYKWVKIGSQTWMAENLAYLPSVSPASEGSITSKNYYVYDYNGTSVLEANATTNYATYGVLYNWPAAMDGAGSSNSNPSGIQGVSPSGWHLPSLAEWNVLESFLAINGYSYEGGWGNDKIGKAMASQFIWNSSSKYIGDVGNNTSSNNSSGFSGLPSGCRFGIKFEQIGISTDWWSTNEFPCCAAYIRELGIWQNFLYHGSYWKDSGLSVRCVRNN